MMFNVPQFINIEDKIVGPLGWKQIFWLIGLGAVLFGLYGVFDKQLFIILAIPTTILFVALAFYRPYGQPLAKVIFFVVLYFFRPKIYTWRREAQQPVKKPVRKPVAQPTTPQKKDITEKQVSDLARVLNERSKF